MSISIFPPINSQDRETEYQLPDIASCQVDEVANESFELTLVYPITGTNFNKIETAARIYCAPNPYASKEYFFIYSISKPIGGTVTVRAEHEAYEMANAVCRGDISSPNVSYPSKGTTAGSLVTGYLNQECASQAVISGTPVFTTDIPDTVVNEWNYDTPVCAREAMYKAAELFGGIWQFTSRLLKLCASRGQDRGFTVQYGYNMRNFNLENNITERYTHIYAYWRGEVRTDTTVGTTTTQDRQTHTVYGSQYVPIYGLNEPYQKIYLYDCSKLFSEKPTAADLDGAAGTFAQSPESFDVLGKHYQFITIDFVALAQTAEYQDNYDSADDRVEIGDTVTVIDKEGNTYELMCLGTHYDAARKRYISIDLGYPTAIQQTAAAIAGKKSFPQTIAKALRQIEKIPVIDDTITTPTRITKNSNNEIVVEYADKRITYRADGVGGQRTNFRKYVEVIT